jgi:hypothetical protein
MVAGFCLFPVPYRADGSLIDIPDAAAAEARLARRRLV